jgi:hypothetical protein
MELKHSRRKPWMPIITQTVWHTRAKRLLVVLLYTFLAFAAGYYVHRSGFSFGQTLRSFKADVERTPKRIQAIIAKPETEHITIDIKHEDYMRLAYQREIALFRDVLVTEESDFVPATVRYKDESIDVRMRLKGDAVDHLQGDKWSFRIKVRGDNTLFGMNEFSIQHPWTRNYVYEWVCNQALGREGLVALRYDFIEVTLNGQDLGVYALEEHFEKRLIENNELREGPIVRFNESLAWDWDPDQTYVWNGIGDFQGSEIDAFQTNELLSDPSSYSQFIKAKNLLESFRRGELKTSDVFDIQKLARYYAITDLMGDEHGNRWTNVRFYYNPITSRLEPIGYDADCGRPLEVLSPTRKKWSRINKIVFSDPVFFAEYVKELERVSEPSYLDRLLAELNRELEQKLNIIHSEFPEFEFSKDILYQNQKRIKKFLNPVRGLHAFYHQSSDGQIELELGNIQYIPIEVLSVSAGDSHLFQPTEKIILPESPVFQSEPVDYKVHSFKFPEGFVWSDDMLHGLKVNYRLLGTSRSRQETVLPWSYLDDHFVESDFIRQEPNVHAFGFLVTDESTQEIFINPGTWDLDQSLIIPHGYQLIAGEGIQLNLLNSAKILSYSPLEFVGSEDYPIVIQSTDSTGQGIIVMNAEETSVLEYVSIENLSNPSQSGWELTGAVTFYESPVSISDSQFIRARAEDALNIIRSQFSIDKTLFSEASSDAIDIDFAKGKITNSSFVAIGNDAIDVSGSVLEIQSVFINGSGDKGLSAGENSQVTLNQVDIKDAYIGLASKDLSRVTAQQVRISDSEVGLAAYQKKSEFGPASMQVHGLGMTAVTSPYLVEVHSWLAVDNAVIEAIDENVYETLYGEDQ